MLDRIMTNWPRPLTLALYRGLLNSWPPYAASGVKIDYIGADYRRIHVSIYLRWFNRNYVGTHFGGSLYAMTDPFYMLMLIQLLGPGHIVWDKAATIRFKKPGKGRVCALFRLTDEDLAHIRAELGLKGKTELHKTVRVVDAELDTVAEVEKVVYIRRKGGGPQA